MTGFMVFYYLDKLSCIIKSVYKGTPGNLVKSIHNKINNVHNKTHKRKLQNYLTT